MLDQPITDPKWVKQMTSYFNYLDKNNNGYITTETVQEWVATVKQICNTTATKLVILRAQIVVFWEHLGLKRDTKMSEKEFINGANLLAMSELNKNKKDTTSILQTYTNAWFNAIDVRDVGLLGVDDLKKVANKTFLDSNASTWLDKIDRSNVKDIDQDAFWLHEQKFWFNSSHILG